MSEELECPKARVYLWCHVAKSGCCDICKELDNWYTVEEEDIEPYEIKQHDHCRCSWAMSWIEGLWADMREQIISRHSDVAQQYYDAAVEIVAWEDKIETAEQEKENLESQKDSEKANASEYERRADDALTTIQQMIDENDELTEAQQELIDELTLQAEHFLELAQDCLDRVETLNDDIWNKTEEVRNGYDQKAAEEYRKKEAEDKLTELEPCLSLGTIENMVREIAGNRLTFEF